MGKRRGLGGGGVTPTPLSCSSEWARPAWLEVVGRSESGRPVFLFFFSLLTLRFLLFVGRARWCLGGLRNIPCEKKLHHVWSFAGSGPQCPSVSYRRCCFHPRCVFARSCSSPSLSRSNSTRFECTWTHSKAGFLLSLLLGLFCTVRTPLSSSSLCVCLRGCGIPDDIPACRAGAVFRLAFPRFFCFGLGRSDAALVFIFHSRQRGGGGCLSLRRFSRGALFLRLYASSAIRLIARQEGEIATEEFSLFRPFAARRQHGADVGAPSLCLF